MRVRVCVRVRKAKIKSSKKSKRMGQATSRGEQCECPGDKDTAFLGLLGGGSFLAYARTSLLLLEGYGGPPFNQYNPTHN